MPGDDRKAQNERFAAVRGMLSLKDAEIAARVGVGRTFLVRLRTATRGISARLADAMEVAFGVRASWLLTGEGTIFSDGEPEPGVEGGVIAHLSRKTGPTGLPIFVGVNHVDIAAVEFSGAVTGGIWKSGGAYAWRPITPTIARWHKCFYLWPTKEEAAFIEGSELELVLMVVPSAYLNPRHAREGARFVCLIGAESSRTLAYATIVRISRRRPAEAKANADGPTRTPRRLSIQLTHRGAWGAREYEYLLDCELQRTVPGYAEVLGVAVRAERGLMWGPEPTFDDG